MRRLYLVPLLIILLILSLSSIYGQHNPAVTSTGGLAKIDPIKARATDSFFSSQQVYNHVDKRQRIFLPANSNDVQVLTSSGQYYGNNKTPHYSNNSFSSPLLKRRSQVCSVISGKDFLKQDSLVLWSGDPSYAADGNVIVSGQYADYNVSPLNTGAFCMKTTRDGTRIWAKLYDSLNISASEFMNLFKSLELQNGNIILAGRSDNEITHNDDFILMKIDANGNMIWLKTYASMFWQGFHGSGDLFNLKELKEDPATGDIYFTGYHWGGITALTKIDPADGHVIWSKGYDIWNWDMPFGLIINPASLQLFTLNFDSWNQEYINVFSLNKNTGDTISGKHWRQTGNLNDPRMYSALGVQKTDNGHFLLTGPTTRFWQWPVYDSTIDLYHAAVVELDANLNYVKAYGFKNRIESNGYNTRLSLKPDGTGLFTMMRYISSYKADVQFTLFKSDTIYHKRRRKYINEGLPYEPLSLPMENGGWLNIKTSGDSTQTGSHARIDYTRLHSSDTASDCLGRPDPSTNLWHYDIEPTNGPQLYSIYNNVFSASHPKTYSAYDFGIRKEPGCVIVSNCDTLNLSFTPAIVCAGTSATLRIHKNQGCGGQVPLRYDTSSIGPVTYVNDSTWVFQFNNPGTYTISGSLLGCQLINDSVLVTVLPAAGPVNLGPDTTICPANTILLNAHTGYASYLWQNGSTDSVFHVAQPGQYYVAVTDACGNQFTDTVNVQPHPPVAVSIGPDRTVCRGDTLHIVAPSGFISYNWQPNYYISSQTASLIIVAPLVDTSYSIKAEAEPGCFAYDTVYVSVKSVQPITLGPDIRFCNGDSVVLSAGTGFSQYLWSTNATGPAIAVNTGGTFWVSATAANGCISRDTVIIHQPYNLPVVSLGADAPLCIGDTRTFNAGTGFTLYAWSNGATTPSVTISNAGTYSVQVTDINGCKGQDTVAITQMFALPAAFLPADTAICNYGNLHLQPLGNYNQYWWSNGSRQPTISITQAGVYWLEVSDNNNCRGKDSILIALKECIKGLYVPSGFTPNNDGRNDLLIPMLFGNVLSYQFTIYNRWGQPVFFTAKPGEGWNGMVKSTPSDGNVFVWQCTYQLQGEVRKQASGTVILIR